MIRRLLLKVREVFLSRAESYQSRELLSDDIRYGSAPQMERDRT